MTRLWLRKRQSVPDYADRVAQIRKRMEQASDGPWDVDCHIHGASGCRCLGHYEDPTGWYLMTGTTLDCSEVVAQKMNDENDWEPKNAYGRPLTSCEDGPFVSFGDADFAANARDDVPFLLGVIEQLEGRLRQRGRR